MKLKQAIAATCLLYSTSAFTQTSAPSNEEIWEMLQALQAEISEIKEQNEVLKEENASLRSLSEATEQVALEASEAVEAVVVSAEQTMQAMNLTGSRTSIGGYGELHYNNLNGKDGASDKKEIDFHRFVLFFGHEFTENLRFFSELELEHSIAGDGKVGEVELEQAYLEYDFNAKHSVTAGLFLVPVGIINETHEPPTFYGTERNSVEKNIIPATWWEAGVMFSGELSNGFSYDFAATSGLKTSGSSYKIRSGRQKVGKASAEDFAYTGRLLWTGVPGVELGVTVQYQSNIAQSADPIAGSATLFETHAVIQKGRFGLRALYANWSLDGNGPQASGADEQSGWYVEPSFRINESLGIFARYSEWDNAAGHSLNTEYEEFNVGINWWLDEDFVFKIDYQNQEIPGGKALDGINLGLGYQF